MKELDNSYSAEKVFNKSLNTNYLKFEKRLTEKVGLGIIKHSANENHYQRND